MNQSPRRQPRRTLARVLALLAALGLLAGCESPAATPAASPAAAFQVSLVTLSSDSEEILAGDQVEVTARVENGGSSAGTYRAELSVDGDVEAREDVSLDPGASTTVRFVIAAGAPGNHEIAIGDAVATLHVTAAAAAAFRVRGLRLATEPVEILAGDPLEFVGEVANEGSTAGSFDAALSVDGFVQARQSATIEAGGSATLRFAITAGTAGSHTVTLGDARSTFTVVAPAALSVTDLQLTRDGVPAGGAVEAVVTVGNAGGAIGTLTLRVAVDGKVAAKKDVTVSGGDELAVHVPLTVNRAGRHAVTAGGLKRQLTVWKITRPANGTVLANKVRGGSGRLTIRNGDDDQDTVVVLAAKSRPSKALLAVYIRSKKSVTINGIQDGRYVAFYTFGDRWDSYSRMFTSSVDRRRFSSTLRFTTTRTATSIRYSIITLKLHVAGAGNASTEFVPDDDFPSVP